MLTNGFGDFQIAKETYLVTKRDAVLTNGFGDFQTERLADFAGQPLAQFVRLVLDLSLLLVFAFLLAVICKAQQKRPI